MSGQDVDGRVRSAGERWALLVGGVLSILLLGPWWLEVPVGDVDPSWQLVMHEAFARRMAFGTEIAWTYGPWGFLWNELYHPATWAWAAAIRCSFAVVLWAVLVQLGRRLVDRPSLGLAWAVLLLVLPSYSWDSLIYQGCAVWWLSWRTAESRAETAASLGLLALLSFFALGKFLLLLALAAVVGFSIGRDVLAGGRPRAAAALATLVGSLTGAWLLAGQAPAAFPGYVSTYWEVASGFAGALTASGSRIEVGFFIVASLALLVTAYRCLRHQRAPRLQALLDVAALSIPLGVAYRHSFTRHDTGHVLIGATLLVGISMLLLPWTRTRIDGAPPRWTRIVPWGVAGGIVALMLWLQPVDPVFETSLPVVKRLPGRAENAFNILRGSTGPFERAEAHSASLRGSEPLGPVVGTVDVYPHAQASVLRQPDVAWVTRPVLQSNTAYSPRLQRMNVDFLRSPDAPTTVLFDIDPSEAHHPAEADSLSVLEILERYDVVDPLGRFVNLRRRDAVRGLKVEPGEDRRAAAGEWIPLPAHDPSGRAGVRELIWLRVRVDPRPWDGLVGMVWKHRLIRLDVRHADGNVESWFVSPGVGRSGLLVSPTLGSRLAFAALLADGVPAEPLLRRVEAVGLGLQGRAYGAVRRGFTVSFDRVSLPAQPGLTLPTGLGFLPELISPPRPLEEHPRWIPGPEGRIVAFAHAPKEYELVLRPGMTASDAPVLRVEFGMLDGAAAADPPTDGVTFSVELRIGEDDQLLWERRLDPTGQEHDRGLQTTEIVVPPGDWQEPGAIPTRSARPRLVFKASPGASASSDWSYWASAVFVN